MRTRLKILPLIACLGLLQAVAGCSDSQHPMPACPSNLQHAPAKSAGCLAISEGKLLVVQEMTGKVNIPGGAGNPKEPAHCSAHRETWEETGLDVKPVKLIKVFDNGFHLFECQAQNTELPDTPPFYAEIRQAMWLSGEDFGQHQWRFPEQMNWLKQHLE